MVIGFHIIRLRIDDQDDFLAVIIVSDDLMEQHQVYILKAFLILRIQLQGWLAVLDIIIGKISYQTTGKGRKIIKYGTVILPNDITDAFSDILSAVLGGHGSFYNRIPVIAGNLQNRVISQKGISSPSLIRLRTFQQICVGTHLLKNPNQFNGCYTVRKDLTADGNHTIYILFCQLPAFLQCWIYLHIPTSFINSKVT